MNFKIRKSNWYSLLLVVANFASFLISWWAIDSKTKSPWEFYIELGILITISVAGLIFIWLPKYTALILSFILPLRWLTGVLLDEHAEGVYAGLAWLCRAFGWFILLTPLTMSISSVFGNGN